MLCARGVSVQYGFQYLINENYEHNMVPQSIDVVVRNFFHLRRLFRIFISDVLTLLNTSAVSAAQLPMYYEPLSDDYIQRPFRAMASVRRFWISIGRLTVSFRFGLDLHESTNAFSIRSNMFYLKLLIALSTFFF